MARKRQRLAAAMIILLLKKKKRSTWVRDWILKRREAGAFYNLLNELNIEDVQQYFNFTRMTAIDLEVLLLKVGPIIKKQDTRFRESISPKERLLLTLRFLASGDSYHSLMYLFRIPVSTISKIVPEVCQALYDCLHEEYLKVPSTQSEWLHIAEIYNEKWNFPNCVGSLDGKHVVFKAPEHSGSFYFNYKGSHSIVLMIVADPCYKITSMNVGCNGSVSDGGVFFHTPLFSALENNTLNIPRPTKPLGRSLALPFVLVADDAFALKPYLMKPFPFKNQPANNRVYNYRLSRAKRMVESVFGIIASKFRIFRRPLELGPEKTKTVTMAACALHNFILSRKETTRQRYIGNTNEIEIQPEQNFVNLERGSDNRPGNEAQRIREAFRKYFISPQGEVPWQYQHI